MGSTHRRSFSWRAGAHRARHRYLSDHMTETQRHSTTDAQLGIAWWNAMSKQARLAALKAVEPDGSASPAEAWEHWKQTAAGFKCEESAHG